MTLTQGLESAAPAAGIEACRIIDLPRVDSPRGSLTFVEANGHVPFAVERVYYLYDVPGGASRGAHAHRTLEQLLIAASGSFDVAVSDGRHERTFSLNRSYYGLYLPRMIWRDLVNFSSGSVCLVLASRHYDESDYIRDHDEYLQAVLEGARESGASQGRASRARARPRGAGQGWPPS